MMGTLQLLTAMQHQHQLMASRALSTLMMGALNNKGGALPLGQDEHGKVCPGQLWAGLQRSAAPLSSSSGSGSAATIGVHPSLLQLSGRLLGRPAHRGFATSGLVRQEQQQQGEAVPAAASSALAGDNKVRRAQAVLSQLPIVRLRQELDIEADHSLHVPFTRFADMSRECGAAADAAGVEQVLNTLQQAGIVLRQGDLVYLRAEEVAEMVMLTLPGGKEDAQAKLERVERELAELDKVHETLERRGHRLANALLSAGLVVLVVQFAAFIYLTWWELSWDVMEPIAYILGLFYSIVAYAYFLAARHAFDLQPMQEFWAKRFKDRKAVQLQFDDNRYQYLRKLQDRYKRHLAHVRI